MEDQNILVTFVRKRKSLVGALVAIDKNQVGWSLARPEDRIRGLDKSYAVDMAFVRACENCKIEHVPMSLKKDYVKMLDRANRYFK